MAKKVKLKTKKKQRAKRLRMTKSGLLKKRNAGRASIFWVKKHANINASCATADTYQRRTPSV